MSLTSVDKLRQELSCQICKELLKEPKSLRCSHMMCEECLSNLLESCKSRGGSVFSCPLCRKEYSIPSKGVDFFPPVHHLKTILEDLRAKKCDGGLQECDKVASRYCLDCKYQYCTDCLRIHLNTKYTMNHKTVPIESKIDVQSNCSEHDQPYKIFCQEKEELICTECMLEDKHKFHAPNDHRLLKGEALETWLREKLKCYVELAAHKIEECKKIENELKVTIASNEKSKKECSEQMKAFFEAKKVTPDHVKKLQEKLEEYDEKIREEIQDEIDGLHDIIANVEERSAKATTALKIGEIFAMAVECKGITKKIERIKIVERKLQPAMWSFKGNLEKPNESTLCVYDITIEEPKRLPPDQTEFSIQLSKEIEHNENPIVDDNVQIQTTSGRRVGFHMMRESKTRWRIRYSMKENECYEVKLLVDDCFEIQEKHDATSFDTANHAYEADESMRRSEERGTTPDVDLQNVDNDQPTNDKVQIHGQLDDCESKKNEEKWLFKGWQSAVDELEHRREKMDYHFNCLTIEMRRLWKEGFSNYEFTKDVEFSDQSLEHKLTMKNECVHKTSIGDAFAQNVVSSLHINEAKIVLPVNDCLHTSDLSIAGEKHYVICGGHPQMLKWDDYGFRMHFPENVVSPQERCEVVVRALVKGNFVFPKGTKLVTAVYSISFSTKLTQPVEVEMQHCVSLTSEEDAEQMRFVVTEKGHSGQSHKFDFLEGGMFYPGNRYGTIERQHFCKIGGVKFDDGKKVDHKTRYVGLFLYEPRSLNCWRMHFVVFKEIKTLQKEYLEKCKELGMEEHPPVKINFTFIEPSVELVISEPIQNGWNLYPLSCPLKLRQIDVDQYGSDDYTPQSCIISIIGKESSDSGLMSHLHHAVSLKGIDCVIEKIFLHRELTPPLPTTKPVAVASLSLDSGNTEGKQLCTKLTSLIDQFFKENQVKLEKLLKRSINEFASQMFEAKLISHSVLRNPSYDQIIDDFISQMDFMTDNAQIIEEHCKKFFRVLDSMGGPLQYPSEVMKSNLMKKVQIELSIKFNL